MTSTQSPSQLAKHHGAKSLKALADWVGKPSSTLINWHRDSPKLFLCVCLGYSVTAKGADDGQP